jgi:filamentous hemagglutinin
MMPALASEASVAEALEIQVPAEEGGMTSLFRAVNPAELSDISANNGVFQNLGSAEGKYFSTTAEGAGSYAQQTFGTGLYEGPYTIVQTSIPTSLLTPVMGATVDGGISTIVIPNTLLPSLTPGTALPFIPLPP